jgi:sortase A
VRGRRVDYTEETRLIVPADASRYGTLIVALFIGAPILLIAFIVYLVCTSKWFRNRKKADNKPHK